MHRLILVARNTRRAGPWVNEPVRIVTARAVVVIRMLMQALSLLVALDA